MLMCYATFAKSSPDNSDHYPVGEGDTVCDVLKRVGIPVNDVKIVFINGILSNIESTLSDGDRVGIFPAVGGG